MSSTPHPATDRSQTGKINRRHFLQTSSTALAAGALLATQPARKLYAGQPDLLRVGLVGCGGRGTGAAAQALQADANVKLTAMGDAFPDRLESSLATLQKQTIADKIDVPVERRFTGFNAYQQVIESGVDLVLLATPPHFRPMHIKAAVDAGKHVFAEKPVAVDAPGVRSVLASCEEAKKKKLSVVSGLCLRYSNGFQEIVKRIQDGALGNVVSLQANDFRGPIWVKPRQPEWTDMEYHMRNWYYFTWLSGDFNVEQHIHLLDTCAWILGDEYPVSAVGTGGRQVRTGSEYGNIYDHHSVIYEFASGVKLFASCRQQSGCRNEIACYAMGPKGSAALSTSNRFEINAGGERWAFRGPHNDMFQTEHDELFASIRKGEPINNGDYMAKSTLLAIMGRMATYTGQLITWDQAFNSQEDLTPPHYDWNLPLPPAVIAMPGMTKFV